MPEGHTIHRIARDHQQWFAGQELGMWSPQGRFQAEAERLSGQTLSQTDAHGKHLFYHFDPHVLHVHLGLYGKFRVHKNPAPEPRGAVRIRAMGTHRTFDLNGPNCCELLSHTELGRLRARLGQDPLRKDADPDLVWERLRKSRAAIGSLLLDQSLIAGIGNVYRAEILHIVAIHPHRLGRDLSRTEFDQLWELAVELLQIGVRYNRIITVDRASTSRPLSQLRSGERLRIYKQPVCSRCGADVYYWALANRTIYACDACQV